MAEAKEIPLLPVVVKWTDEDGDIQVESMSIDAAQKELVTLREFMIKTLGYVTNYTETIQKLC